MVSDYKPYTANHFWGQVYMVSVSYRKNIFSCHRLKLNCCVGAFSRLICFALRNITIVHSFGKPVTNFDCFETRRYQLRVLTVSPNSLYILYWCRTGRLRKLFWVKLEFRFLKFYSTSCNMLQLKSMFKLPSSYWAEC